MILDRTVEVAVRVRCDVCKRNEGEVRKVLAPEREKSILEAVTRELRTAEARLEVETATGQKWLVNGNAHVCPVCSISLKNAEKIAPALRLIAGGRNG